MNDGFLLSQIIYGLEALKRFSNSLNNAFGSFTKQNYHEMHASKEREKSGFPRKSYGRNAKKDAGLSKKMEDRHIKGNGNYPSTLEI